MGALQQHRVLQHHDASCSLRRCPMQRPVRAFAARRSSVDPRTLTVDGSLPTWKIRMLYDGECPLCMRETNMLRSRDAQHGNIDFVDVASPEYSPQRNAGLEYETAMGEIHALLPDATTVTKVEVFRRLYDAVGLGWVYAITKIRWIERGADAIYDVWARYRLPITGRPALMDVMESRCREGQSCRASKPSPAQR